MKSIQHVHQPRRVGRSALLRVALLISFCATAFAARAQSTPRIGVVDMGLVTSRSRTIQESVRKAEDQVRPDSDRAEAKMRQMQSLRQSLADRRSVMKAEDVKEEQAKISALYDEIEELKFEINKKIKRVKDETMEPELHRVVQTVEQIAKSEGYDLILSADTVLFHTDAVDVTPLVIQALDRGASAAVQTQKSTSAPASSESSTPKKKTTPKRRLFRRSSE